MVVVGKHDPIYKILASNKSGALSSASVPLSNTSVSPMFSCYSCDRRFSSCLLFPQFGAISLPLSTHFSWLRSQLKYHLFWESVEPTRSDHSSSMCSASTLYSSFKTLSHSQSCNCAIIGVSEWNESSLWAGPWPCCSPVQGPVLCGT